VKTSKIENFSNFFYFSHTFSATKRQKPKKQPPPTSSDRKAQTTNKSRTIRMHSKLMEKSKRKLTDLKIMSRQWATKHHQKQCTEIWYTHIRSWLIDPQRRNREQRQRLAPSKMGENQKRKGTSERALSPWPRERFEVAVK
jgi:hypothetical protein